MSVRRKNHTLGETQKKILELLSKNPLTINEVCRKLHKDYSYTYKAFKRLDAELGLITVVGEKEYRNQKFGTYWLTQTGVFRVMRLDVSIHDLLIQAKKHYPQNNVWESAQLFYEAFKEERFREYLMCIPDAYLEFKKDQWMIEKPLKLLREDRYLVFDVLRKNETVKKTIVELAEGILERTFEGVGERAYKPAVIGMLKLFLESPHDFSRKIALLGRAWEILKKCPGF